MDSSVGLGHAKEPGISLVGSDSMAYSKVGVMDVRTTPFRYCIHISVCTGSLHTKKQLGFGVVESTFLTLSPNQVSLASKINFLST